MSRKPPIPALSLILDLVRLFDTIQQMTLTCLMIRRTGSVRRKSLAWPDSADSDNVCRIHYNRFHLSVAGWHQYSSWWRCPFQNVVAGDGCYLSKLRVNVGAVAAGPFDCNGIVWDLRM